MMARLRRPLAAIGLVSLLLLGWQHVCDIGLVSPVLLPSPAQIAQWLWNSLCDGSLPQAMLVTLRRLLCGYVPGLALGLALGVLVHASRLAADSIGLAALGLQTLPSVCWTPLALLWFGQSEAAMLFVVIMGSVWSMLIATRNALDRVPRLWLEAASVMGAPRGMLWNRVLLPAALPALVAGARLGWAFAWRSLMAAEIYVTVLDSLGLGQLLHFGRELQAMEQAVGVMLTIVLLGMVADRIIFLPLERRLQRLWGD